jgi:hypothetical protein
MTQINWIRAAVGVRFFHQNLEFNILADARLI